MIAVRELLRGLAAEGRTIIYSSHVLDVMEKVCARVLILRKGRVAAYDTIERLRLQTAELSLEGIFARLTQDDGQRQLASRLLGAMQS
jgi:ABC-2 type transport system ATP-binding protein